jgi:hypothetical protein
VSLCLFSFINLFFSIRKEGFPRFSGPSHQGMASSASPLVGCHLPILIIDNAGYQRRYIQCYHHLDRVNELMNSFKFVRILDPAQLPSQAV